MKFCLPMQGSGGREGEESESEVTRSCLTLQPHGLPGFTIHGIFWARILEWIAISFSNAGEMRFNPWSRKIPHTVEQLSPRAATIEAHAPQSLCCSATREATTMRSPHIATESSPPLTATRESPCAATKTQHSQK